MRAVADVDVGDFRVDFRVEKIGATPDIIRFH